MARGSASAVSGDCPGREPCPGRFGGGDGRGVGTASRGAEVLPWAWRAWPDARWKDATHVVAGNRGFSEWTFRGTGPDGRVTEMGGVDLFEIRDGLIARKDTDRNQRG